MKAETWIEVSELFCATLELAPRERAGYLARSTASAEVRGEVERLLALHERGGGRLAERPTFLRLSAPAAGTRIGQYVLQRVLGSGGMGTVFEALQSRPQRTVALKTLRHGLGSPERLQRFLLEAEVLGRLRHPSIAQIYEAGTHEEEGESFPYFAMELVSGARDVFAYARDERLGLAARLALFLSVCDAVHHGHQKGVIHRDLKPGNILVAAEGRVKVIDFGVARATRVDERAARTQAGQLVGTLATMSPEQLAGDPGAVDARSDVYSLGVVLYELVAGRPPYELGGLALEDALKRVREARPPRTSDMPEELHWIVLRALEKEPERRYDSASELAADLRRFARRQPVLAGPPSRLYTARKFVQRHALVVAGSAALVLALVAGILGTSWQAAQARAAHRAAETQTEVARSVADFLDGILRSPDPELARGRELTARELLDEASKEIEGAFDGRPEVEIALRTTIGRSYQGLASFAEAERHLRAAATLARGTFGPDDGRTLEADNHVTWVLYDQQRQPEAAEAGRATLAACRRVLGDDDPRTWRAVNNLAPVLTLLSEFEEADRLLLDVLAHIRARDADHEEANDALGNLAFNAMEWGHYAESERYYREALAQARRVSGDDAPETLIVMTDLANVLFEQGERDEAEPLFDEAVASSLRVLGSTDPRTLRRRTYRAGLWIDKEKLAESEAELRAVIEVDRAPVSALNTLAICLLRQGRRSEAVQAARDSLAVGRSLYPPGHADNLRLETNLAHFLHMAGQDQEALEVLEPVERALVRDLGRDHPSTLAATYQLGLLLLDMGERDSARALIEQVVTLGDARHEKEPFLEGARAVLQHMEQRSVSGLANE